VALLVATVVGVGVMVTVLEGSSSSAGGEPRREDVGVVTPVTPVTPVRTSEAPVLTPLAVPPELAPSAPLGRSVPERLVIASIGVDTPLMDLGFTADGELEVPPDGTIAGWFTGAPTPGESGAAVIAGHVDWIGPAVFHDLVSVAVGDSIEVTRADGSVATFDVMAVGQYPKDEFPTTAVYGNLPYAGLRVITCGGVFNDATGHYLDNVVVYARLVSSTPAIAG